MALFAPTATELLRDDHQKAKELMEKIEAGGGIVADREDLLRKLAVALKAHVRVEKEIFYPAVIQRLGDQVPKDLVDHQRDEETKTSAMLDDLLRMGPNHPDFNRTLAEFKRIELNHAIRDEEQRLFPLVEASMDKDQLKDLGKRMKERQDQLHEELEARHAR